MFRFNPGIENKIFPPKAPYYKTKTKKEKEVIDWILNKKQTSKAIQANNKILSERYNLPLGKPMSYIEANEGKENPNYKKKGGYLENCQTCTMTHLLRRRGFDIQTKPNTQKNKRHQGVIYDMLDSVKVHWMERFLNPDNTIPKYSKFQGNKKTFKNFLTNELANDGLYEIFVGWKENKKTHVFLAEVTNGYVRYFDPQSGESNVRHYLEKINLSKTMILRIDDKIINPKLMNKEKVSLFIRK